jgi:nitrogen regulatory protein P-II 1
MKKIECIIRPERLEKLKEYFVKEGVEGMTISDVRGFGSQRTRPDNYLVLPKIKVEVYCQDDKLDEIIDLILTVCSRKQMGDGKIAIIDVQELIKVRTGERSSAAVAKC